MTRIALALMVLLTAGLVAGCEKRPDPCATLTARLCEGKDRGYCLQTRAFLDRELTGPDGRKLTGMSRAEGCRLILADPQVVGAYSREAQRQILDGRI